MPAFLSSAPQILTEKGFWEYKRCNCGGGMVKYKNGTGLEVWIVRGTNAVIRRSGRAISNGSINDLTNALTGILNNNGI